VVTLAADRLAMKTKSCYHRQQRTKRGEAPWVGGMGGQRGL